MQKKNVIIICVFILFFMTSCFNTGKISHQNISFIYQKNFPDSPEFCVFHNTDSTSAVFINYHHHNPGFPDQNDSSAYLLNYKLYNSFGSKIVLDSSTIAFPFYNINVDRNNIELKFDIKTTLSEKYLLEINFADTLNNKKFRNFISINKKNKYNRRNYILKNKAGEKLYKNHIAFDEKFRLKYRDTISGKLIVNYYRRKFPIALPPFIMDEKLNFVYSPDSVFNVEINNGETCLLNLKKSGFYHFIIDTLNRDGFSIFRFYDGFPLIKNASQMIDPLRYITEKKEFEKLIEYKDYKFAIEKFWTSVAGSEERATILIKNYYRKVQEANCMFSSYHEGWKTDRGLIHIIFGAPNIVYKEENIETWIYGEPNKPSSLVFDFIKVDNPFTDNDFRLIKSPSYKTRWYFAVEAWRR
ncbi:MAG: GWxTD domain-containing protein [Bacteroidales bacterium]|nr:GWxTD domain-containing protein [Bacteroidales bacterium]